MAEIMGYVILGIFFGFVLAWFIQQSRSRSIVEDLKIENAELKKDREADSDRMKWLESAETTLKESFQALSAEILSSNSEQFLKRAREKLNELLELQKKDWGIQKEEFKNLVDPLNKGLTELDKQIEEMEQRREGAYRALQENVTHLSQSYQEVHKATIDLTQALKSTSVRGRWGQVQLRRIAEMAGMIAYIDFIEQVTTEEGRPDMVVNLPNGGIIPVDSKAPMDAYLQAQDIEDEDARLKKLDEHAKAVRSHMKTLSQKAYWSQFERSPELVVMVVPYDPGLTAAFERDGKLLEDALENKVMIVSPVSLLALLKVIAYGWLQLQLAENAQRIAEQGKDLYNRIITFSGHLQDIGSRLNSTVSSYNKAVGSMESRVLPSIRRLKEMGAGTADVPELSPVESQSRLLTSIEKSDEE